jgi:hypothetical protein
MPPGSFVYQIFYDDASRRMLDPGFLALDNTSNERPDWYEFWPIRRYLRQTRLEADAFYGFLSPKFPLKTGLTSAHVDSYLRMLPAETEVLLLSPGWDQIAYFQSVFEQGEYFHPGLIAACDGFFKHAGISLLPATSVTHSLNSVFSNFIVARPRFWERWLALADQLFDFVEGSDELASLVISYRADAKNFAPLKTFIQERLATVVLLQEHFEVLSFFPSASAPIFDYVFVRADRTRGLLIECDRAKQLYAQSGDARHLEAYRKLRSRIEINPPPAAR